MRAFFETEHIREMLRHKEYDSIALILKDYHPVDIAEIINELSDDEKVQLFKTLEFTQAVEVLEELDTYDKYILLSNINISYAVKLISEMSTDEVADFFGELDNEKKVKFLSLLKKQTQIDIKEILAYDKDSAGGRMTTEFIAFPKDMKAGEVIDKLGELSVDAETIYYVYVVDSDNKLVGVVSLRDLILAPADTAIEEFMWVDVKKVLVTEDQEEVAKLMKKYGLLALPVVDDDNELLGIVTVDDVFTVVEEEATEDMLKFAGSTELETPEILKTSLWFRTKRRLPWILIAVVGEIISGSVINNFSHALQAVVALSFFIPVLMDMGGNVGTQSAAIAIRGLATGEIKPSMLWKNIAREAMVGLILGVSNGIIIAIVAYLWKGNATLGIVVGIAMTINLVLAAVLGSFIPLLWHKLGRDPAVASGPLITTILDILCIFIYFSTAVKFLTI